MCRTACSDLINPRARLSVELSWLPGVAADRANEVVGNMNRETLKKGFEWPPLARANALAARIEGGPTEESEVVGALLKLSSSFDEINPEILMREVNEDRSIANFPLVEDMHLLQTELAARRRYYRNVSLQLLDSLPTKALVRLVTELAAKSTDRGRKRTPSLVEDIVESYEDAAQPFMEGERYNIRKLLVSISLRATRGEHEIGDLVESLRGILGNWNYVIKPIQLVSRASGFDHPATCRLALQVKALSVELGNRNGFAAATESIIECLRNEFAFLSEFSDRVSEEPSAITIDYGNKNLAQARVDNDDFDHNLPYSAEVGLIFKNRLELSATRLTWQGHSYEYEKITSLRWGRVRHISTGTSYVIYVQTPDTDARVRLRSEDVFNEVTDRLWRSVGTRLLREHVDHLKKGGRIVYPGVVIEDNAITLIRKRLFKGKEAFRLTWNNVCILSNDGYLLFRMKSDNKISAAVSFTKANNTCVVEEMLGLFVDKGKSAISSVAELNLLAEAYPVDSGSAVCGLGARTADSDPT